MTLETDLVDVLDRHWSELRTNTPPEVLAAHMLASLRLFEDSLIERSSAPAIRSTTPADWTLWRPSLRRSRTHHEPPRPVHGRH